MYKYDAIVKLHDTDAAGILYFGNYYRLAHAAYEDFMESIDYSLRQVIEGSGSLPLIVHSEADFKKPLKLGDRLIIRLGVERIGETSFTLVYHLTDEANVQAATLRTVHVAADRKTGLKTDLPADLREKLSSFKQNSS
jgi:1,4-dihydroxy-2-naphthoyl-CoA hydrolase